MTFMLQKHTAFDPVLNELKDLIEQEGENKLLAANLNVQRLKEKLN